MENSNSATDDSLKLMLRENTIKAWQRMVTLLRLKMTKRGVTVTLVTEIESESVTERRESESLRAVCSKKQRLLYKSIVQSLNLKNTTST